MQTKTHSVCAYIHVCHRLVFISSSVAPHIIFETESVNETRAHWLARLIGQSFCLLLPNTGAAGVPPFLNCYADSRNPNSDAHVASPLVAEPSPTRVIFIRYNVCRVSWCIFGHVTTDVTSIKINAETVVSSPVTALSGHQPQSLALRMETLFWFLSLYINAACSWLSPKWNLAMCAFGCQFQNSKMSYFQQYPRIWDKT